MRRRVALAISVVMGCGDNLASAPEDAAEEPVSITVTRQSVPLAGIAISFHRADGSLVATRMTSATGRAEARTGAGGFVTAVTSFASDLDVETFANVQPGDQLVLDGAPSATTPMTTYGVRVAQVAGAVFYRVGVRCLVGTGEQVGANTNPVELSVTTTCLAPTETLVTALDGFGLPIESVLGAEATPTEGGIVDLAEATPSAAETATLTLSNAPADGTLESVRVLGRVRFLGETEPASNGAHPAVFPDHEGARQVVAITGDRPVFGWGEPATMQTLDAMAARVATIREPTIDRATRTVAWSGAADANFAFGQLRVEAATPFLWSYAGPLGPGATSLALPALEGFSLDAATRIDLELGAARVTGEGLDTLRVDGGWLAANNGVVARARVLLARPPAGSGSAGMTFVGSSLTF